MSAASDSDLSELGEEYQDSFDNEDADEVMHPSSEEELLDDDDDDDQEMGEWAR